MKAQSLRFDASADALSRTTSLPPIANFTLMGWFRIAVDRNALSSFFALGPSSGSAYYVLQTNSGGTQIKIWNGSADSASGADLAVGVWYHLALVCDGTGAGNLRVYVNGILNVTAAAGTVTAAKLWVGNDNDGEWLNGSAAAVKIYDRALTVGEILQEMRQIAPVSANSLNSWYAFEGGPAASALLDGSTEHRDLTAGGTLAIEEAPPLPWRVPTRGTRARAVAAAGNVFPDAWHPQYPQPDRRTPEMVAY